MTTMVNLLVMLGVLVLMPLGLRLIRWPGVALLVRLWPVPAVLASVALWLPRGVLATALVVPYALMTVALIAVAAGRAGRELLVVDWARADLRMLPERVAIVTALVTPSVAAMSLVAERAGYRLFGFRLTVLQLTVPHLHYAGFAAALVAGLLYQQVAASSPSDPQVVGGDGVEHVDGDRVADRRGDEDGVRGLAVVAALAVPAGTGLVMLGHFVGDWTQLLGAVVLTTGMWSVAWLTWTQVRPAARDRLTGALLAVSSAVLVLTMLLALSWAAGRALGLPHLSLTWMVATHGIGNALGFATCALLAWRRMAVPGQDVSRRSGSATITR